MNESLTPEFRHYLAAEYPHNHNYRIRFGRLWPSRQLRRRARRIQALYPQPLTSLLDLSVSKGYFVTHAALQAKQCRVLGIDVSEQAVAATSAVADHLGLENLQAEHVRLHELAAAINDHGGAFQTVLMINMYQYLYYGGITEPDFYQSHEEVFGYLRTVCDGTLIFSNCVDFERLPPWIQERAREQKRVESYTESGILRAAEASFQVIQMGMLGTRPLWKLTVLD